MLDLALTFLRDELNSYLTRRTGSDSVTTQLTRLTQDNGKLAISENSLALTLINVEEEKILRSPMPELIIRDGKHMRTEPPLRLNLIILIAAHFRAYDQALKYLSYVLACFQSQPVFRPDTHAALDASIDQINVELQSTNYEQLNQIWAYLGTKFLPSVIYKLRLVAVRGEPQEPTPVVGSIDMKTDTT